MTDDITLEDIVRRVVEGGRSISSLELITVCVTEKQGDRSETHSRAIRVGDDGYEWSDAERGRHRHPEELNYRGQEYFRDDPATQWKTADVRGQATAIEHIPIEKREGTTWDEALISETYALDFNQFLEATRLPDELITERSTIRLSATTAIPSMVPSLEDLERHMPHGPSIPPQVRQEIRERLSEEPDSLTLIHDLWIDADSWLLMKMETKGTAHRRGEVTESFETWAFSKFNEAELPRPLPD